MFSILDGCDADATMNEDTLARARRLSDTDLLALVKLLAKREREATVTLVAHLAILDERRLFLMEGFASLFTYCVQALDLSEHAAYNRIEVARAVRKFPRILTLLVEGAINLTTARLLAPHLTPANHTDILRSARHKGKREVEEIISEIRPQPSVVSSLRMLPATMSSAAQSQAERPTVPVRDAPADPTVLSCSVDGATPLPRSPAVDAPATSARASMEPLGTRRYRVQFTASAELRDKLTLAQNLLRHQVPDGDLGEIVDRAMTLLLEHLGRQKFAATSRPRPRSDGQPPTGSAGTRHIPAEVKRTVWLRDGGRCAFVARNGHRCQERGFLEFHHVVPHSTGGAATAENLELRCRTHNIYEATLFFEGFDLGQPGVVSTVEKAGLAGRHCARGRGAAANVMDHATSGKLPSEQTLER